MRTAKYLWAGLGLLWGCDQASVLALSADASVEAPEQMPVIDKPLPLEMVLVPGGAFYYGCSLTETDVNCRDEEPPGRILSLPTFLIDRLEVTRAEYLACMEQGACSPPNYRDCQLDLSTWPRRPVSCLHPYQAEEYCAFRGKRLPTEFEWEKAARGTDGRIYPWGNSPELCGRVHQKKGSDCASDSEQLNVGSFPENQSPYGALDMAGGVSEWVEGSFSTKYPVPVHRGGRWGDRYDALRCSHRMRAHVKDLPQFIGTRCARDL